MKTNDYTEPDLLRRYLLQSLETPEFDAIEQRLFDDEGFSDLLDLAEDDLIEDYVRGNLSAREGSRFESAFLNSRRRQIHLDLTRSLVERYGQTRSTSAPPRQNAPIWTWAAAAGVLLCVAGATVSSYYTIRIGATAEARAARLEKELLTSKQRIDSLMARNQAPSPHADVSFSLLPGMSRGTGRVATLGLPPDNPSFRLQLEFDSRRIYTRYEFVVLTLDDTIAWSSADLKTDERPGLRVLNVSVPSSAVRAGRYKALLFGIASDGKREELADYAFDTVNR